MRTKEIFTTSLGFEEIDVLQIIAKQEYGGNASAAMRDILRSVGRERGLLAAPVTVAAQPKVATMEAEHA